MREYRLLVLFKDNNLRFFVVLSLCLVGADDRENKTVISFTLFHIISENKA